MSPIAFSRRHAAALILCIVNVRWMLAAAARPSELLMTVNLDSATRQYVAAIRQRTPLQTKKVVVDLSQNFLWVQCANNSYESTTYKPVRCRSAICNAAEANGCGDCYGPTSPGCNNNTCGVSLENTVKRTARGGELARDVLALNSTNGIKPGALANASNFTFACAPAFLLKGLAAGVAGMGGLSKARFAFPSQLAAAFSFPRRFAMCLPSGGTGVIFFGGGPYVFLPGTDFSKLLIYTPLVTNSESKHQYYINVKGIQINGKEVSFNSSLLNIDSKGNGGTTLSTVQPYTRLAKPIYETVRDAFVKAAEERNISRVSGVKPFDACFNAKTVSSTQLGASVPAVGLVLQNSSMVWQIFGANSVVSVSDDVLCLAFLPSESYEKASIVIGGFQMENNLLEFDLASSRLGFSGLMYSFQTSCSNSKFTSVA